MSVIDVRFHETRKCAPGSLAWHPQFGLVDVLQSRGWQRMVRVGRPAPGALAVLDVDVRELELIAQDATVGVAIARPMDAERLRSVVDADDAELTERRDWERAPVAAAWAVRD